MPTSPLCGERDRLTGHEFTSIQRRKPGRPFKSVETVNRIRAVVITDATKDLGLVSGPMVHPLQVHSCYTGTTSLAGARSPNAPLSSRTGSRVRVSPSLNPKGVFREVEAPAVVVVPPSGGRPYAGRVE